MRFALFTLVVALLAAYAMAVPAELRRVIVSYPNDTPWSVVHDAIRAIKHAGGKITHEYNIIKGFACDAPAAVLEQVQALNTKFVANIEEDGVVHTQGPPEVHI